MAIPVRKAKGLITLAGATLLGAFPAAGQQVASYDDEQQKLDAHVKAACAQQERAGGSFEALEKCRIRGHGFLSCEGRRFA